MTTLLTAAETAAHLRCCTKTLRTYVRAGDLVPVQLGGRLRFRTDDIEAFIQAKRRVSAPPRPEVWEITTGVGRLRRRSA